MTTVTVTELVDGVAVESTAVTIAVVEGVAGLTQAQADALYAPLGSSGAVDSVNGNTGVVVLDADDIADGTTNHAFTAADDTKLAGVATGATANDTDANLKARANHTGTQAISTVTGLQTALDGKDTALAAHEADTTSVHGIADTSALVLTGDSRLTDSRTPTAHATSHQDGGTDELALDGSQITTGTVPDARIASTIARDTEVTAAVTAHEGLSDPHPGYLTTAEGAAAYQPLDSDLTAIAALTTTSFGRAVLALADAAAGRTAFGLGTAATSASTDFQPIDSDLTAIAALTTTSFGRSLLAAADAAALRTLAGLTLGTDIYSKSAVDAGFQPLDSDLTAIAALTTTSYGRALLAVSNLAGLQAILGTTGTPSSSTYLRGDGSWATPSGGSSNPPKMVELAADKNLTSTTYADLLTTTFTPTGTAVWMSVAGAATVSGTSVNVAFFQFTRDNGAGGAGASVAAGSLAVATSGAQFSVALARKFTGLTAGVTYAIALQHKQDASGGTFRCRPASFPANEELTLMVGDCA